MDTKAVFRARLRDADEEELDELLAERSAELDAGLVRQLFRNPFLTSRHVEALAANARLVTVYAVRRELVGHPRTPRTVALQHVGGLHWGDLVRIGSDTRLHPLVRRTAERRLIERLPANAVGEKIAIARSAGPAVLSSLRSDPSPRVIAGLLENPRLTESVLLPVALNERTPPPVLSLLARDRRWGARIAMRRALCRNPSTPAAASVRLLPGLAAGDLATIAADSRLPAVVRRRAADLAGGRAFGTNPDGGD